MPSPTLDKEDESCLDISVLRVHTRTMQIPTAGPAAKRPDSREHSQTQMQGQGKAAADEVLFRRILVDESRVPDSDSAEITVPSAV